MNIQEIQTLINYKVPLKTFIINNEIYGITKSFQKQTLEVEKKLVAQKDISRLIF